MKKSVSLNRKLSRMIAKNLIVLLTLLVVGCVGMFSWFTNTTKANADGIGVKCDSTDGIEIAVVERGAPAPDDSEYSNTITLDESSFLAKLTLSEITSNGIEFYCPALTQLDGVAMPETSKEWLEATPGQDYISFDLYIRTQSPKNVYIDGLSSFNSVSNRLVWNGGENTVEKDNASTYGYFSRDAIVGATRTSIMGYDKNKNLNQRKLLWIPRPDIHLKQDGTYYQLITGLAGNNYGTYTHNYCPRNQSAIPDNGAVASTYNTSTKKATLTNSTLITTFDSSKDGAVVYDSTTGYYYTHVVYNAWIEGEDSEARLALSGGKFTINLKISSENTKS